MLFLYYIKKIFRINPTLKQDLVKGYYNLIINYDGYYRDEKNNNFTTYYPKCNSTIKIRKKPSSDIIVFSQILEMEDYKPVVEILKII